MIKILYITSESISLDPILSSQVLPLLEQIAQQGRCTLITFEPKETKIPLQQYFNGVKVVSFRKKSPIKNLLNLFLWLIFNTRYFDVIHVRSYPSMIPAVFCRIFGITRRLIFDPRGLFGDELLYYGSSKNIARVIKYLEFFFLRYADATVTVSRAMKHYFIETYHIDPKKIEVISTFARPALGYAPNIREANRWQDKVILCYSGSMEGWQCFDDILNLFYSFSVRSDLFRFVFFSKSAFEMREIINNKLQPHLYAVCSASSEELPNYLAQCDYGFLVRKPHVINRVSAPIKSKDYLLAGLRLVVTSGVGDTSEFLSNNDCGITFDYKDIVTGNIDYSQFEKPVSVAEKKRISKIAASEFSLEVSVNKYWALYSEILLDCK
jgi:glycosyltransferase involved in cell wall biosynthesis